MKANDYITRHEALRVLQINFGDYGGARRALCEIPAADVAPVVHGRWIRLRWENNNYCCDCSECGEEAMYKDYQRSRNGIYPICPNCGARMYGKDGDGNEAPDV